MLSKLFSTVLLSKQSLREEDAEEGYIRQGDQTGGLTTTNPNRRFEPKAIQHSKVPDETLREDTCEKRVRVQCDPIKASSAHRTLNRASLNLSTTSESDGEFTEEISDHNDDFKIIRLIGTGAFGKVFLVQKAQNGTHHAMKVVSKAKIISQNMIDQAWQERRIL